MSIATSSPTTSVTGDVQLEDLVARPTVDTAPNRISPLLVSAIAGAGELTLTATAGLLAASAWVSAPGPFTNHSYGLAILATSLAGVVCAQRLDLFTIASLRAPLSQLWRIGAAWATAIGLLIATLFLLKVGPEFSRGWLILWFAGGLAAITAWRGLAYGVVRNLGSAGRLNRRAVIYGAGPEGASLVDRINADPDNDVAILGIFDDRATARVSGSIAGLPLLGNVDQLLAFCRSHHIDMLILSLPITAEHRLLTLLKKLWVLPLDIRLAAHTNSLRFRPRAYSHIGSVPLLDLFDRPLAEWDNLIKLLFDKVLALHCSDCARSRYGADGARHQIG
ncbi:MAG: hypothetical protein R3D67_16250 [Hyphomicrobiaceae bacterium]